MATPKKLTAVQKRAALALSRGKSHVLAAKEVGVHQKSIQRWVKLPEFQAAVEREIATHRAEFHRLSLSAFKFAVQLAINGMSQGGAEGQKYAMRLLSRMPVQGASPLEEGGADAGLAERNARLLREIMDAED